jgi:membrane protein implicated in regulation of membrane protease activity
MALLWIIAAIVAVGIEAGVLAALLAWIGFGFVLQAVGFLVTALLLPVLIRKRLLRLVGGGGVPSRTDPHIGVTAEVTQAIDPITGAGRVLVNGEDWAARSSEPLPAGAKVTVTDADGIVLVVENLGDTR